MAEKLLYQGEHRAILFWRSREDALADWETWFYDRAVSDDQRKKLSSLLRIMCSSPGPSLHPSEEKYRHEFDKIYAIKSYQLRLYGFVRRNDFVILYMTIKKTQRLSKNTIDMIKNFYKEYIKERG